MLNISAAAVSKWENGRSLPDISILPELSQVLGCTIDHLSLVDTVNAKAETDSAHNR